MAGSVIIAGARTPIGKLSAPSAVRRHRSRGLRHQGRARPGGRHARAGRLRVHGPGAAGRRRPDHGRQAAANAGIPMTVPATTVNKVCLSGLNSIYLADLMIQAGARRDRRGRRHGVDDPGPLPAAGRPRGLPAGRQVGRRLDDVRRPVLRLRPGGHGRRHREVRGVRRPRASPRTTWLPSRTSGPPPPSRRAASPTRSSRSRSPSARATRRGRHRRGRAPRHHGRVARQASARPSTRPATSPPATPRRSPTAAPP